MMQDVRPPMVFEIIVSIFVAEGMELVRNEEGRSETRP